MTKVFISILPIILHGGKNLLESISFGEEMTTYRLIVEGNVVDVGFRILIKRIARILKIKGYVRNLDDNVEIFCETDASTLGEFIKRISAYKADLEEDPFAIYVENVHTYSKGDKEYQKPVGKLGKFNVLRDEKEEDKGYDLEILNTLEAGTGIIQCKFGILDYKYGVISKSLTSLVTFFKLYSIILGIVIIIILFLVFSTWSKVAV